MAWDTNELTTRFNCPENVQIISYLITTHPCSHSDVGQEVLIASNELKCAYYCPDGLNCSYLVLHTESNVIFAAALGMSGFALRLPESQIDDALAAGAALDPKLGTDWVSFYPFDPEIPTVKMRASLKYWCRIAFEAALQK
jgi:hypothetical protein